MNDLKQPELVGLVMATIDKILHAEKGKVLEAEGVKLHPSEIHLLLFLENHPGESEEDLRQRLTIPAENKSQSLYVSEEMATGNIMVKDENVCLHCGLCAERCPTSSWEMIKFIYLPPQAKRT